MPFPRLVLLHLLPGAVQMGAGVAPDACVLSASRFRRIERRPQPTAANTLQQQDRFDAFVERYNRKRPHEGLAMHVPADVYTPSPRAYAGLPPLEYPYHDWSATVTHCGRVCYQGQKVNVSQAFAGQLVGVRQVGERIWLVTFMHYDLGYF